MPAGSLPRPSGGSRRPGRTSIHVGASVISRPNATFTSGSTASMCKPGSRRPRSACWSTPEGKKELVGLIDGVRESAQSWKELLLDLKRRGLSMGPELAVADGALGFWQALEEVWPRTRGQRCWGHKTANVLNKLPKSQQSKAKRAPFACSRGLQPAATGLRVNFTSTV